MEESFVKRQYTQGNSSLLPFISFHLYSTDEAILEFNSFGIDEISNSVF
jgi:hypothetical protein